MASLQLYLLGTPCLKREGTARSGCVVPTPFAVQLDTQKTIALLVYLAVNQQPCSRAELAALLWPESAAEKAQNTLRGVLSRLRQTLGGEYLHTNRTTIGLAVGQSGNLSAGLWVDVIEFHRHLAQNSPDTLARAVSLYRNDFLAGFSLRNAPPFDEWQAEQTRQLRREAIKACKTLTHFYTEQQVWETALSYAQRWLALDPLHEAAHRCLMNLYDQQGNRSAALSQYQACVRLLAQELDVAPESATTQLYHHLRAGRSYLLSSAPPLLCSPSPYPLTLSPSHPHATLVKTGVNKERNGDFAVAGECYRQALALAREAGDGHTAAQLTSNLAILYQHQGKEPAVYLSLFFESLDAFTKLDDPRGRARVLVNIGCACLRLEQYDEAQQALEESLACHCQIEDDYLAGVTAYLLGKIACETGYARAALSDPTFRSEKVRKKQF